MIGSVIVANPAPGVRLIEINRPERRNALDGATYGALADAVAAADADETVGAIVLAGTQGVFTAGNDLADFQDEDGGMAEAAELLSRPPLRFLQVLSTCGTPVLAGVEGFAVGIGATMLLHCDLAYAGRAARLRLPFVALGLCPEGASSLLLPMVAGSKAAAELLLLGEEFTGEAAARHGLVNEAVPDGTAVARALERAGALARLPMASVRASKALLRHALREPVAEALRREAVAFDRLRREPAAQAAFAAFLRKGRA